MRQKLASHLTHEALFRGEDKIAARGQKKILLLGCGALGSWLTDVLARQGHNLTVVDFDRVEEGNFGTQNYGKSDLGRPKSAQTANNTFRRIGVKVEGINRKITTGTVKLLKRYDLVVDLFDNWESRELVRKYCEAQSIPCIHAGLAAMGFLQVMWNETYKIGKTAEPVDGVPCEYPLAANLVHMCVAVVAEVINQFIDDGKKSNVEVWLRNFSTEVTEVI